MADQINQHANTCKNNININNSNMQTQASTLHAHPRHTPVDRQDTYCKAESSNAQYTSNRSVSTSASVSDCNEDNTDI